MVERTRVDPLDVPEDLGLARGLVNRNAHLPLQPADFQRARGAGVQQLDERFVEQVYAAPQIVQIALHACPFSQRTYAPARPATSGAAPCSAMTFTRALPTTAASAQRPT